MRKKSLLAGIFALAVWALLPATAAALDCPPVLGVDGVTRQYTVNPASACAYGDGNLNGAASDAFLFGTPTYVDPAISAISGWSFICSSGNTTDACAGLGYTVSGDLSNGTWSITGGDLTSYHYLVGLKDGATPQWALFLVTALNGTWSITNLTGGGAIVPGTLSHVALYRAPDGGGQDGGSPPEPAALTLFGLAMVGAAHRLRKRRAAR